MVFDFTTEDIVHIHGMLDEFIDEFGALYVMEQFMNAGVCSSDVLELLGLEEEWWHEVNNEDITYKFENGLYDYIEETDFDIEKIWDILDELDETIEVD